MSTVIRTVWGEGFSFLRIIHDETMTMPQKRSVVRERIISGIAFYHPPLKRQTLETNGGKEKKERA